MLKSLVRGFGNFHSSTFPASSCMNLGLNSPGLCAGFFLYLPGCPQCFILILNNSPFRNRDSRLAKYFFALKFVDIHTESAINLLFANVLFFFLIVCSSLYPDMF